MDEQNLSPLRKWFCNELEKSFPPGTVITSNRNSMEFKKWTGIDQQGLEELWKSSPGFTTCNSFLSQVFWVICRAGGLSAPKDYMFKSFQLPNEGSRKTFRLENSFHYYNSDLGLLPQPGDFFEMGTPTKYEHVGIILDITIDDEKKTWTKIEAGQAGKRQGFDSIKRNGPSSFPGGSLLGWINIDEYFAGWKGSSE